jgi:hypothetical protein
MITLLLLLLCLKCYMSVCTAANCTSMAACDKPVGPYPTWVGNVPIVQAYYSSK